MIVIENITTKQQDFLTGHSNTISCLDVSRSGSLIASGQVTFMGFKVLQSEFLFWFLTRLSKNRQYIVTLTRSRVEGESDCNWKVAVRRSLASFAKKTLIKLLTYTVFRSTQPPALSGTGWVVAYRLWYESLVWLIMKVICLRVAPRVQFFVRAGMKLVVLFYIVCIRFWRWYQGYKIQTVYVHHTSFV